MLHAGIYEQGAEAVTLAVEPGASQTLDSVAALAAATHRFLRTAWFAGLAAETLVARRPTGEAFAAVPLVARGKGLLRLKEVPGSYWPYRSFPLSQDAGDDELAAMLASPAALQVLGRLWRIGPIYADDPTGQRLVALAGRSGWTALKRRLGTCYIVDLKRLTAAGPWPSSKTLRKNRWCERRLAEMGELEFRTVSGPDWSPQVLDRLAAIEAESWVGADGGDSKFLNRRNRAIWERALEDPALGAALSCSLLHIGGEPAAFTFKLTSGATRYFIANSYSARFADRSPGRVLLYRDLQQAVEAGIETIGWGAGDPGYKSEMGAEPGPEILDFLFVRGGLLAALARPLWERRR